MFKIFFIQMEREGVSEREERERERKREREKERERDRERENNDIKQKNTILRHQCERNRNLTPKK